MTDKMILIKVLQNNRQDEGDYINISFIYIYTNMRATLSINKMISKLIYQSNVIDKIKTDQNIQVYCEISDKMITKLIYDSNILTGSCDCNKLTQIIHI